MKTQKMCINIPIESVVSMSEVWGSRDQRRRAARLLSVGQQPSYTEIVTTTTTVCSAALISDVPCSRRFCYRQEWVPFECSFYLHQRKYKFPSMSFITRRASHHIPQLSRIYGFWQFGCGSVAKNSKVIVKQSLINSNLFVTDYCEWQETKNNH